MKKYSLPLILIALFVLAACSSEPTMSPTTPPSTALSTPVVVTSVAPETPVANASPLEEPIAQATEVAYPIEDPVGEPTAVPELIELVAQDLKTPWEIVFLPDGRLLVNERPGTLTILGLDGQRIAIADVFERSESGLLGLVLHPDFEQNHWLYLYLTYQAPSGMLNRVERYRFDQNELSERTVILDNIPGANNHDGGRMEFGPDGLLYITTGDAQNANLAQDTNSLAGKILRLNDDGSLPADNPFGNPVYSYGHRNPQGLAWDSQGRLWSTEHGPSGAGSGYDELNLIEMGANYGWPIIQGDQTGEGMVSPRLQSGGNETWAPGDLEIVNDIAFFVGLRGSTLYAVPLDDIRPETLQRHFAGEYGRLRTLRLGPDGLLYMGTSNTDGRATPQADDDRIFKVDWRQLQ